MKALLKSVLVAICIICITFGSALSVLAQPADTGGVEWCSLGELIDVTPKEKYVIIKVKVDGKNEKLFLSFPTAGGIHLSNKNIGFFIPKSVNEVNFKKKSGGRFEISANTDVLVILESSANPWRLKICDKKGNVVTEYNGKSLWYGYKNGELYRICIENTLDNDEVIYGLGERFNSFNRVGISTQTVNQDAWSKDDTSYKNVPIIHSSKGYTFFYNSAAVATADIGKSNSKTYSYDARGDKLDFFVWIGEPLENMQSYTSLTGTTMIPPKWAFHYMPGATTIGWKSTNNPNELLEELVEGFESYGITEIDGLFGEDAFRKNVLAYYYLKEKGIRMLAWNAPFQVDNMYRRGSLLSYLPGHSSDFADYDLPIFRTGDLKGYHSESTVDFSHPAAKEMVQNLWKTDISYGLRGLMLDYGEHIGHTQDLVSYADMYAYEAHNFNSYYYAKTYYEAFNEVIGKGEWLNYMRSGAAGSQSYATSFGGDQQSTFEGMRQALNGMLSASASGFTIYGTDIGGLGGASTNEIYTRWLQMSTFSPLMRAHGSDGAEAPWEQCDMNVFLEQYWLRESIIDKIYSSVIASNKNGAPLVQAMALAYPKNTKLLTCDDQYLFCDDFLVCPVLTPLANKRSVSLPNGTWTDMRTGAVYNGSKTYTVDAPLQYSPVFLRAGAVIPVDISKGTLSLFDSKQNGENEKALLVTAADNTRTTKFWTNADTATKYKNEKTGNTFTISADKAQKTKVILAMGVNATAVSVDGTALKKLNRLPVKESDIGYFVDGRQRTVIRLPANKSWSKLSVKMGASLNTDYALNKKITFHSNANINEFSKPEFINDGNLDTSWVINKIRDAFFEVDLGHEYEINEIVFKWNANFPEKYSIELSKDGENWSLLKYVEDGDGKMDNISFDATAARYIRVANFYTKKANTVDLYDFNVYGVAEKGVVAADKNDVSESEEGGWSEKDEIYEENETSSDSGKKQSEKKNNALLIIGMALGAVILAAGVSVLVVFGVRRNKKTKKTIE